MKKITFMLLAVMVLFAACENNEDGFELSTTSATLMWGADSLQIVASSPDDITYESDDPFVATVTDEGLVRTLHVGTTTISVVSGGETKKVNVAIVDNDPFFQDPLYQRTVSSSDLISKYGEPSSISDAGLYTYNIGSIDDYGIYMFIVEDGYVTSAGVWFDFDYYAVVSIALLQRWQYYGELLFGNTILVSDATAIVTMKYYSKYDKILLTYMESDTDNKSINIQQSSALERFPVPF